MVSGTEQKLKYLWKEGKERRQTEGDRGKSGERDIWTGRPEIHCGGTKVKTLD